LSQKTPAPKNINSIRNAVIVFAGLLIVALVGYGLYYTRGIETVDSFVEGEHYDLLEGVPAESPHSKTILVREYFSYYCIHCRNFDPQVEAWRETIPDDVVFERSPVAFSPVWEIVGQSYYALAATGALTENHPRIFRAIHENGRQFPTAESMADFVDGHGVSRDDFLEAYRSPDVRRAMLRANDRSAAQRIDGVPSLVVADRYRVNLNKVPRAQAFDVVNFLIEKERQGT